MITPFNEILNIITTGFVGYLVWYLKTTVTNRSDSTKIDLILMRCHLYQRHRYLMEAGEVDAEELNELEELYEIYHRKRGNGSGTKMINEIRKLKLK